MSMQVEVGSFSLNTGSATTTVTTGFQGKAVILWTNGKTATGESSGASFSMGFSDGTNYCETGWVGDDAVATTNVGRDMACGAATIGYGLRIMTNGTPTLGTGGRVNTVAFNATPNMVLTMNATPASAWLVNYILFGGADITNVLVGRTNLPTTPGTLSVTTPGFQGNAVFMMGDQSTSGGSGPVSNAISFLGFASSSTSRWAAAGAVADAVSSSASVHGNSKVRSDACLVGLLTDASTNIVADFTQFTSTGFDLNVTTAPTSAYAVAYLVIQGGQWGSGVSAKPTTATAQSFTGLSFTPKLFGMAMTSATAVNTTTTNDVLMLGAATGTTARAYAAAYHNSAVNTVANSSTSNALIAHEPNATANADFTSFNSDGATITWDATGTAFQTAWFAATDTASAPTGTLIGAYQIS